MNIMLTNAPVLGLSALSDYLISSWVGPALLLGIAVVALILGVTRKFRELIGLLGVAIIASLIIFFGGSFFGKDGGVTSAAKKAADKINVVELGNTSFSPDFLKLDR